MAFDPLSLALSVGGSVLSTVIGSSAARSATNAQIAAAERGAKAQAEAMDAAMAAQMDQFNRSFNFQVASYLDQVAAYAPTVAVREGALLALTGYEDAGGIFPERAGPGYLETLARQQPGPGVAIRGVTPPVGPTVTPPVGPTVTPPVAGVQAPPVAISRQELARRWETGDVPSSGNNFWGAGSFQAAYQGGFYPPTHDEANTRARELGLAAPEGHLEQGVLTRRLSALQSDLRDAESQYEGGDPGLEAEILALQQEIQRTTDAAPAVVTAQAPVPVAPGVSPFADVDRPTFIPPVRPRGPFFDEREFTLPEELTGPRQLYPTEDEFVAPQPFDVGEFRDKEVFAPDEFTQPQRLAAGEFLDPIVYDPGRFREPFTFDTADLEADPGYQFRRTEAENALARLAAARGTAFSGGEKRELARIISGHAAQEYGAAYARQYADYLRQQNISQTEFAALLNDAARRWGVTLDVFGANAADVARRYQVARDVEASRQRDIERRYGIEADIYGTQIADIQRRYDILTDQFGLDAADAQRRIEQEIYLENLKRAGEQSIWNRYATLAGMPAMGETAQAAAAAGLGLSGLAQQAGATTAGMQTARGNVLANLYGQVGGLQAQGALAPATIMAQGIRGPIDYMQGAIRREEQMAHEQELAKLMGVGGMPSVTGTGNRAFSLLSEYD